MPLSEDYIVTDLIVGTEIHYPWERLPEGIKATYAKVSRKTYDFLMDQLVEYVNNGSMTKNKVLWIFDNYELRGQQYATGLYMHDSYTYVANIQED